MSRMGFVLILSGAMLACESKPGRENPNPNRLGPLPTVTFELGGETVEIEVAVSEQEQAQGLMYRDAMPKNHGMLFVYDEPRFLSFWMKNTKIPLSIAFLREDGTIGNIKKMKPYTGLYDPQERYLSKYQSQYALEMNQGWFEEHGIGAGDTIPLPFEKINKIKQN